MKAGEVQTSCKLSFLLLKTFFVIHKLLVIIVLCQHLIMLESGRIKPHFPFYITFVILSVIDKILVVREVDSKASVLIHCFN